MTQKGRQCFSDNKSEKLYIFNVFQNKYPGLVLSIDMSKTTVILKEEKQNASSKATDNIKITYVFTKLWFAKKLKILQKE